MFARRTGWDLTENAFTQTLEQLRSRNVPLLDLTAGNPTDPGLHDSEKLKSALQATQSPQAFEYHPQAHGLLSARQAVAKYYSALFEPISLRPEQVVLTTSTSEAYAFIFRLLCDPGDEVLVPRPSYPLFDFLAGLQDVTLVQYPLFYDHGWHVDVEALRLKITARTRAIIVVHPNNPTGSYVKPQEAVALNRLCVERGLALIADEVFYDYPRASPPPSFAGNTQALTFTLSGLSKIAGLPQMKVAWMVISGPPERAREALARMEIISDTFLSMNTPLQLSTAALLEYRRCFQAKLSARLAHNGQELDRQLAGQQLCRRLESEGGWYATLRVPRVQSDEELALRLMRDQGVIVHPGHFFDFAEEGFLVISLMTAEQEFREGIRRVLGLIQK